METAEPPNKRRRQHHVVGGNAMDWFMSLRSVGPVRNVSALRSALRPRCSALCVLTVSGSGAEVRAAGVVGGHQRWSSQWPPISLVSC